MTRSQTLPGSDFPGPVGTTVFVECSLRAETIRDALDRAEQALLSDGYRIKHISRCLGYDLDDWNYDEYPANSDFRQRCETLVASDNIEFGPFCYSENGSRMDGWRVELYPQMLAWLVTVVERCDANGSKWSRLG